METINEQEVTAILDLIIEDKKKKSMNKEKAKQYCENWLKLARDKGMSNLVIKYFYEGYTIIGPEPFKVFIDENKQSADKIVNALLTNDMINNVDRKFALATGILAVLLNDENAYAGIIKSILVRYKHYCINKEGEVAKSVPVTLRKYLAGKIDLSTNMVPISELGLQPALVTEIVKLLNEQFYKNDGIKANESKAMAKVINWLTGEKSKENSMVEAQKDKKTTVPSCPVSPAADSSASKISDSMSGREAIMHSNKSLGEQMQDSVKSLFQISSMIDRILENNRNEIAMKDRQLDEKKREISALKSELASMKSTLEFYKTTNCSLEAKLSDALIKIENSSKILDERSSEINRLELVINVLKSKTDTEVKQMLNKKANDLKPYYRDYLELTKQGINIDTAEMAVMILEDVFDRLEKLGFKFK